MYWILEKTENSKKQKEKIKIKNKMGLFFL